MSLPYLLRGTIVFRLAQIVLVPALSVVLLVCVVGNYFYNQITTENQYMVRYGKDWKSVYEAEKGPLSEARGNMAFGLALPLPCPRHL